MPIDGPKYVAKTLDILQPPALKLRKPFERVAQQSQQSQQLEKSLEALAAENKPAVKLNKKGGERFIMPPFLAACVKRREDAFMELTTGRSANPKSAIESAKVFKSNNYGANLNKTL